MMDSLWAVVIILYIMKSQRSMYKFFCQLLSVLILDSSFSSSSKETVLTAHSTTDYENHSYTVHYNYNKRASEKYTILCFNENFEIDYNQNKDMYVVITRSPRPSKEILEQIDEILTKNSINTVHIMDHQNCGRCVFWT